VATAEPIMASVAGRYASALFELATEQRQLASIEKDLAQFQQMLDQSSDLQRFVRSPVFAADTQVRAIDAVLGKAGIGGLTANFLKLIARNRRLFAVADMIKAFRALAAQARGEVEAEVTSAIPLNDGQLRALKDTLKVSVGGKDVALVTRVDQSILGGLVVKLGSRMIDSSIRTKLNSLKFRMKEVQ